LAVKSTFQASCADWLPARAGKLASSACRCSGANDSHRGHTDSGGFYRFHLSAVDLPCLLLLARTLVTSAGVSARKISLSVFDISPRLRLRANFVRKSATVLRSFGERQLRPAELLLGSCF
jgi:hypothetical protein